MSPKNRVFFTPWSKRNNRRWREWGPSAAAEVLLRQHRLPRGRPGRRPGGRRGSPARSQRRIRQVSLGYCLSPRHLKNMGHYPLSLTPSPTALIGDKTMKNIFYIHILSKPSLKLGISKSRKSSIALIGNMSPLKSRFFPMLIKNIVYESGTRTRWHFGTNGSFF